MQDQVIILPGDGKQQVLGALRSARQSVLMSVFRFSDHELLEELRRACARDVNVKVLLSRQAKGWRRKLQNLTLALRAVGAQNRRFKDQGKKSHAKYLLIDGQVAYVMSFNFTKKCLGQTYDFGLVTSNAEVVKGLTELFDRDWNRTANGEESINKRLIVSPIDSRKKLGALIKSAKRSLRIIDHRLTDLSIIRLLVEKAKAGVRVEILGDPLQNQVAEPLVEVRGFKGGQPHGKLIIVDDQVAGIGSIALRAISLEKRRELSATTDDRECVARLADFFKGMFYASSINDVHYAKLSLVKKFDPSHLSP